VKDHTAILVAAVRAAVRAAIRAVRATAGRVGARVLAELSRVVDGLEKLLDFAEISNVSGVDPLLSSFINSKKQ
jgi:hypothetical protein